MFAFVRRPCRSAGAMGVIAALVVAIASITFATAQEPTPVDPVVVDPSLPRGLLTEPLPEGSAAPTTASTAGESGECGCETGFNFKNVPVVRVMPRLGNFPIPPGGPGYYSLLDILTGDYREAPPKYPYPRFGLMPFPFYDASFAYLDDPKNTEHDWFDPLKRIRLGENWLFSTGGDYRTRFEDRGHDRLTRVDNDYSVTRVRTYGDLWYKDQFRLFIEYFGAWSAGEELAPLGIDEDYSDLVDLFVDIKLGELAGKPVYVRGGRQELLFGSQRLVSPLEWANARRTFQGVRAMRKGEKVDVDLFWVQPVIPDPERFDSVDNNVNFAGAYTTTRTRDNETVDLYYFLLDNTNRPTQQMLVRGPATVNTIGSRYLRVLENNVLLEAEGGVQLGAVAGQNLVAGFGTAGAGYQFKDAPLTPTFWAYYDYASGDDNPGLGTAHTFNQLFPFGHYYLGWIDLVGRQNIHDMNFHLYLFPTKWTTVWLQYHRFWLASPRDALYNAAGIPIRRDASGAAGTDVGRELDVVVNFHLSKHADFMTGYSYLFGGDFLSNTSGPNLAVNSSFYFAQMTYRW